MPIEKEKVIGIVGGMGPEAGLKLFQTILTHTPASVDQDHLSVVLMSFPGRIADRTAFLEGEEQDNPAFAVATVIGQLENAGAEIVGIACNTSHAPRIFQVLQKELLRMKSGVRLVHMPYETCRYIKDHYPVVRRVGVMATNGTYKAGVYADLLREWGFEAVLPDAALQRSVIHRIIYDRQFGIKANANRITPKALAWTEEAIRFFRASGAEAIILGCTELSLICDRTTVKDLVVVDATEALAIALIREARVGVTVDEEGEGRSKTNDLVTKANR